MDSLYDVQKWLRSSELVGLVIPSTDEFITEFTPPVNSRLRWVTGFRGSTGTAVILRDAAALFLDGRYLLQGELDIEGAPIAIEATSMASRRAWLQKSLSAGASLGIDARLHSMLDMEQWRSLATDLGIELKSLKHNPIDHLWSVGRPAPHQPLIVDYPVWYAGQSREEKCALVVEHVRAAGLEALLLADPEDVSWLLNVRASEETLQTEPDDWPVAPTSRSRALVRRDGGVTWFVDQIRVTVDVVERTNNVASIAPPETLASALAEVSVKGGIGADPRRTPAALASIVQQQRSLRADDAVAHLRWRKHPTELARAREAHLVDASAVVHFMAWLTQAVRERRISEFEAARTLEAFRRRHPSYKGPSMPIMSASGPSGAQPHYFPRRNASRYLNDHPIFWIDSGGQYFGGTTDNTITMALDTPSPKHVLAHTLILQGFIALATACVPVGTYALRLDSIARQPLWREGMDYGTGTGHGVGNYMNAHEGPSISREPGPTTMAIIEPGMIVTNEPGYYAPGDFGLRIESHMVANVSSRHPKFLEFETISRLPIDSRLVDLERLSPFERKWLGAYHRTVLAELEPRLDVAAASWLRERTGVFVQAAEN